MSGKSLIRKLPAMADQPGEALAVVETPQGSLNKYDYDPKTGLFELGSAMPSGVVFPFEFGFIPSTLGEDGDPLDVVIIMDAPTFAGCLVRIRILGVIEAVEKEIDKKWDRNDRLIAVASKSRRHENVMKLEDLSSQFIREIEDFFISYNSIKGKKFKVLGRYGPRRAFRLIKAGIKAHDSKK